MNVTRGLWRAWIFVTLLWVVGTAWVAYIALPEWVAQKYQYVEPLRKEADPNQLDRIKDNKDY
jgi:hypothetical protein